MIFYHGTSRINWKKIKKEKCLWGIRNAPNRCTYLAIECKEARCYGKIVLKVYYNPFKYPTKNNFIKECWQFRVYEKIDLKYIKELSDR